MTKILVALLVLCVIPPVLLLLWRRDRAARSLAIGYLLFCNLVYVFYMVFFGNRFVDYPGEGDWDRVVRYGDAWFDGAEATHFGALKLVLPQLLLILSMGILAIVSTAWLRDSRNRPGEDHSEKTDID